MDDSATIATELWVSVKASETKFYLQSFLFIEVPQQRTKRIWKLAQ